jgi:hypothetical protein
MARIYSKKEQQIDMRYYIYVSQAKVSQLYAQVPVKLRQKIAAKFTIDLKLIKAEFEGRQTQESLFSMLEIVTSYLADEALVGTADNPNVYFKEVMPLNWGPYYDRFSGEPGTEFVYFGGRTEKTIVGLGGSLTNVIGEVGAQGVAEHSYSGRPMLTRGLRQIVEADSFIQGVNPDTTDALKLVNLASGRMGGPRESMEFVAKRLVHGTTDRVFWVKGERKQFYAQGEFEEIDHMNAVLGSPLYVAMAE